MIRVDVPNIMLIRCDQDIKALVTNCYFDFIMAHSIDE